MIKFNYPRSGLRLIWLLHAHIHTHLYIWLAQRFIPPYTPIRNIKHDGTWPLPQKIIGREVSTEQSTHEVKTKEN